MNIGIMLDFKAASNLIKQSWRYSWSVIASSKAFEVSRAGVGGENIHKVLPWSALLAWNRFWCSSKCMISRKNPVILVCTRPHCQHWQDLVPPCKLCWGGLLLLVGWAWGIGWTWRHPVITSSCLISKTSGKISKYTSQIRKTLFGKSFSYFKELWSILRTNILLSNITGV